jgi:hypothetical protein
MLTRAQKILTQRTAKSNIMVRKTVVNRKISVVGVGFSDIDIIDRTVLPS